MFDALMDQTVSLFRATITQDASGGALYSYPATATKSGIIAAIQPAGARDVQLFAARNMVVDVAIYSEYDFDGNLAYTDQANVTTKGLRLGDKFTDAAGVQYIVRGVKKDLNTVISFTALYKIFCQRIIN